MAPRWGKSGAESAPIIYTHHAHLRMAERAIGEREVEEVLEHYHTSYRGRKGETILVGHSAGRRVKVVLDEPSVVDVVIITVAD